MDLWQPDPDPAIAQAEASLTDALSSRLYHVHAAAHVALGLPGVPARDVQAAYHTPVLPALAKADGSSRAARLFAELKANPPRARRAEDLADALTQQWMEAGLLRSEAERAVVAANAQGRIEAARAAPRRQPDTHPGPDDTLAWGVERACLHVTRLRDTTRALLAGIVVDALLRGDSPQTLSQTMSQQFGTLNRDARRLAITEVAFARANGFLTAAVGRKVRWFTAAGCCAHCQELDGTVYTVMRGPGNPARDVWAGKHNVGMLAADRTPAIPLHPNCRCRWVIVEDDVLEVSERTKAALATLLDG